MDCNTGIAALLKARFTHQDIVFTIRAVRTSRGLLLQEINLLNDTTSVLEADSSDSELISIGARICDFFDGFNVDFSAYALDMGICTDFQRGVLNAARKISRGTTVSYAELGRMAGYPGAVRAAASVMRKNRFPIIIPCHRVIRSTGEPGGYCGVTEGRMAELKKRLIEMERLQ